MKNIVNLTSKELTEIYGGNVGDSAEALGIMAGSIAKWGPLIGNVVGSYKLFKRIF